MGNFNWRYGVMAALFAAGCLCLAAALGDSDPITAGRLVARLALFASGAGMFAALARLVRLWESRGEIPGYTGLYSE